MCPRVALSIAPGIAPPVRQTSSRSARPMVRLARKPGPSAPMPLFRPMASRTGPLTTASCPAGWVVTAWPCRLNADRARPARPRPPRGSTQGGSRPAPRRRPPAPAWPPHRGRDQAEGLLPVPPAEHRLDPLRGGRDHRQAVGPAALEHLLQFVGAVLPGHRRHQAGVDGCLRGTPRLDQRLGPGRHRQFGAELGLSLREQAGQGPPIPAGHGTGDHSAAADEDGRRHGAQPVGQGCRVRRVLRGHLAGPAEAAGRPDRQVQGIFEDGDRGQSGRAPRPGTAGRGGAAPAPRWGSARRRIPAGRSRPR